MHRESFMLWEGDHSWKSRICVQRRSNCTIIHIQHRLCRHIPAVQGSGWARLFIDLDSRDHSLNVPCVGCEKIHISRSVPSQVSQPPEFDREPCCAVGNGDLHLVLQTLKHETQFFRSVPNPSKLPSEGLVLFGVCIYLCIYLEYFSGVVHALKNRKQSWI